MVLAVQKGQAAAEGGDLLSYYYATGVINAKVNDW